MYVLLLAIFAAATVACTLAAITGYRGDVCTRGVGYTVPARVEQDPDLRLAANKLVARWDTVAAALSALPLVLVGLAMVRGWDSPSLAVLVGLTGYAFVLGCLATYPFERIKRLPEASSRP